MILSKIIATFLCVFFCVPMLILIFEGAHLVNKYLGGGMLLPEKSLILLSRAREDDSCELAEKKKKDNSCFLDLKLFRGKIKGEDWRKITFTRLLPHPPFTIKVGWFKKKESESSSTYSQYFELYALFSFLSSQLRSTKENKFSYMMLTLPTIFLSTRETVIKVTSNRNYFLSAIT